MDARRIIWGFLKRNRGWLAGFVVLLAVYACVFYLYQLPLEAFVYGSALCAAVLVTGLCAGMTGEMKKIWELNQIRKMLPEVPRDLPEPVGRAEELYQEMLVNLGEEMHREESCHAKRQEEMLDYYTLWVHQIKTPISAMRLLLQSQEMTDPMLEMELFKIEQYVEMVLGYLRCESMNADFSFQEYDLDDLVRQAVKKYKKLFILKKISLDYQPLQVKVLTDEKWLVFVLEQVLSNGLKYTVKGKISVYMAEREPKTLVIADTGIGIAPEDVERVFERGFTGNNGRQDKRSTGIGLYLVKKIMTKLSCEVRLESSLGEGTKVYLDLEQKNLEMD